MRRVSPALLAAFFLLSTITQAWAVPDLSPDAMLRDHLWRELLALPQGERPKVGLALSSGAVRALAHTGVIQALEYADFPVDVIAGTSMGAIVGAFYASGLPAVKLRENAESMRLDTGANINTFSLFSLIISDKLLSSKRTDTLIRTKVGDETFADLSKPFACVATDLYSGESIIFREGDLATAVRASMNIPGLFAPVEYRHRYLVDGGVVDYIPVDAAKLLGAQWILASVTETDYTQSRPQNVLESLEQVIDIRSSLLSREEGQEANFVIAPPVGDIGVYETNRIHEAIDKGVIAATKRLPAAQESLLLFSMPALIKNMETGNP